ncbi:STN domain-containing protein [Shewanella mangrovi]|uniref:STN domain-containing protein n=1 Tax=Shewanella mangrovi TaxID=1515746 RepID=UPI00068B125D|nr:STN domain-containing protein [Shewanella mangrovi]
MKNIAGILLLLSLTACNSNTQTPVSSDRCDVSSDYQLDFQRLDETLQQIAHGSGCFIEADLNEIGAVKPNAVIGRYSVLQAVEQAIAGKGLTVKRDKQNGLTISKA